METTDFIWKNGEFVAWDDAKVHILTHTLHYGAGAFEGIRAYKTEKGPAIFRLKEHIERLYYSTKVIGHSIPFTQEELFEVIIELVQKNKQEHCYIRPLAYFGYGKMGLNPTGAPSEIIIACWPWGAYLPHEMVDLKVSSYIRIHPRSTIADAKICGHYVNSILAVRELIGTTYHEALFLDLDGNIAEGPGENIFMVKDREVITPPLGTILAGITRETVISLLRDHEISVREESITDDMLKAADEAFFTGTAAEITPIRSLDDHVIGDGTVGEITQKIKSLYLDIVHGRFKDEKMKSYERYLTYVS